ncbi:IPTL-CTERM sorting domain-containing protein [Comamonas sp. MYb21]|uniref:IPTL-CTERM sorting domain-containing protein n=1 Tax=Comamonas sp. MYb21 TaxID=1848648 RepID=UPI003094BF99
MKKFLIGLGLSAVAAHASATYTIFLTEVGTDVVASASGTVDTTGMTAVAANIDCTGTNLGAIVTTGTLCMGSGRSGIMLASAITNPQAFGPGTVVSMGDSGSGDPVYFSANTLYLPANYVSGSTLVGSNTYAGKTLATLGVTAGTYTYNLTSGDKIVLNIGVAELLFPTPSTIPVGQIGAAYSLPLAATGGSGEISYQLESGTLPAGLSLNTTSGLISGTPTEAGYYSVSVLAKDGANQQKSVSLFIVIDPLDLVIQSMTLPGGTVGTAYNSNIVVTGGVAPYSFTVEGEFPDGLNLNPETGAITGTPTKAQTSNFSITVTDSSVVPTAVAVNAVKAVSTLTQNFSITINAAAVVPATATPVPTLGEWGMISLSALLMGLFGVVQRRKRKL